MDIVTQFSHLKGRSLIGYGDLPQPVITAVAAHFDQVTQLKYTRLLLHDGFPLIVNPFTEFFKNKNSVMLDILATLPIISEQNSVCTMENLVSLTYKVKDKCYSGPLFHNDFVLISCKHTNMIVKADLLTACYTRKNAILCPEIILKSANDSAFIGLPWIPGTLVNFPRTHIPVPCKKFHPILHLGGRYYLSTMKQNIELSTGTLHMLPLAVYHIPCNERHPLLKTGFGDCPKTTKMSIAIFHKLTVNYIPWTPPTNLTAIEHYFHSVDLGPDLTFNTSLMNAFDNTFNTLDHHIQQKIALVKQEINSIKETTTTETAMIVACIALTLSVICLLLILAFCFFYSKLQRCFKHIGPFKQPPRETAVRYVVKDEQELNTDFNCDEMCCPTSFTSC